MTPVNKTNSYLKKASSLFSTTFVRLTGLTLLVGILVRIILIFNQQTQIDFSFTDWMKIFLLGMVNDICIAVIGCFFVWLLLIFLSDKKYQSPWKYIILGILGVSLGYVLFFNTIFDEYGSAVPKIVKGFLAYKFISFGIRLFIPSVRKKWSFVTYNITIFIYVFCILFNAVSEYFFWNEFGVRYNFIAVDYLVYTNEVIGNIFESYPIVPLLTGLFIISGGITYFFTRKTMPLFNNYPSFKSKLVISGSYLLLIVSSCFLLNFTTVFQNTNNVYVNELQSNGMFKFYTAFMNSELDYNKFYVTIPEKQAISLRNKLYDSEGSYNIQQIKDSLPEVHKNIILITVESLSASFLKHYGNKDNITPNLDQLIDKSLVFNNLYATGNRTVRGLEAVTLCIPPSPGESIIKRPDNSNLFSTGKILKDKGYIVQYLYGGDSYFDNMKTFFSGNGYEIIDKKDFSKDEITFSNIWGVCDEDMFTKALKIFDSNVQTGKPFFGHIMSVSNHRPFTYPEGKIDIPGNSKSRDGGVKYTDYAIGKFIKDAEKKPWFNNTIFVIIADHCASSAGKTEIPLDNYHIPALIYAPGYIQPKQVNTLASQIDIMPTVFGLLHFSYASQFYGKNILSSDFKPRALVATYQNMGYWEDNLLTILSPVKKVEQYQVQKNNFNFKLFPLNKTDSLSLKYAIANYQTIEPTQMTLKKSKEISLK